MPALDALLEADIDVVAVVTNPDRPAGRGMEPKASPVKLRGLAAGVDVLQPEKARDPWLHDRLKELEVDVATVVAYGQILPRPLLEIPPLGFVNLHFSLLPAYRGAAPVQRALMDGVRETGVSVMVLDEGMDTGPLLAAEAVPVKVEDTAGTLGERLATAGARLLAPVLKEYAAGRIVPTPQDHERASYAPKVTEQDARIDWSQSAETIRNLVRACNPSPGAWTTLGQRRLKVFRVEPAVSDGRLAPGEVDSSHGLHIGARDAALSLEEVQAAGRRRMTGGELARGLRLSRGERAT